MSALGEGVVVMVDRSMVADEPPIYARLRDIYDLDDADWAMSMPPQFPRAVTERHGWAGWFEDEPSSVARTLPRSTS